MYFSYGIKTKDLLEFFNILTKISFIFLTLVGIYLFENRHILNTTITRDVKLPMSQPGCNGD